MQIHGRCAEYNFSVNNFVQSLSSQTVLLQKIYFLFKYYLSFSSPLDKFEKSKRICFQLGKYFSLPQPSKHLKCWSPAPFKRVPRDGALLLKILHRKEETPSIWLSEFCAASAVTTVMLHHDKKCNFLFRGRTKSLNPTLVIKGSKSETPSYDQFRQVVFMDLYAVYT